ncbi:hypothetical protein ADUPG1_010531, partial [Aduncisulcus paluster]
SNYGLTSLEHPTKLYCPPQDCTAIPSTRKDSISSYQPLTNVPSNPGLGPSLFIQKSRKKRFKGNERQSSLKMRVKRRKHLSVSSSSAITQLIPHFISLSLSLARSLPISSKIHPDGLCVQLCSALFVRSPPISGESVALLRQLMIYVCILCWTYPPSLHSVHPIAASSHPNRVSSLLPLSSHLLHFNGSSLAHILLHSSSHVRSELGFQAYSQAMSVVMKGGKGFGCEFPIGNEASIVSQEQEKSGISISSTHKFSSHLHCILSSLFVCNEGIDCEKCMGIAKDVICSAVRTSNELSSSFEVRNSCEKWKKEIESLVLGRMKDHVQKLKLNEADKWVSRLDKPSLLSSTPSSTNDSVKPKHKDTIKDRVSIKRSISPSILSFYLSLCVSYEFPIASFMYVCVIRCITEGWQLYGAFQGFDGSDLSMPQRVVQQPRARGRRKERKDDVKESSDIILTLKNGVSRHIHSSMDDSMVASSVLPGFLSPQCSLFSLISPQTSSLLFASLVSLLTHSPGCFSSIPVLIESCKDVVKIWREKETQRERERYRERERGRASRESRTDRARNVRRGRMTSGRSDQSSLPLSSLGDSSLFASHAQPPSHAPSSSPSSSTIELMNDVSLPMDVNEKMISKCIVAVSSFALHNMEWKADIEQYRGVLGESYMFFSNLSAPSSHLLTLVFASLSSFPSPSPSFLSFSASVFHSMLVIVPKNVQLFMENQRLKLYRKHEKDLEIMIQDEEIRV